MTRHGRIADHLSPNLLIRRFGEQCHTRGAVAGGMIGMHWHPVLQRPIARTRLVEPYRHRAHPLSWLGRDPVAALEVLE